MMHTFIPSIYMWRANTKRPGRNGTDFPKNGTNIGGPMDRRVRWKFLLAGLTCEYETFSYTNYLKNLRMSTNTTTFIAFSSTPTS